jgi:hypothetical protein
MRWTGVTAESIDELTARSSKAATQRRNAVARYRFKLLDRHDAMAIASVPIPSSRGEKRGSLVAFFLCALKDENIRSSTDETFRSSTEAILCYSPRAISH